MRAWRMTGLLSAAVLGGGLLTACSDAEATPPPVTAHAPAPPLTTAASTPAADPLTAVWPTYHRDNARSGLATDLAPLGTLRQAWRANLDGAVYGQPLVVGDMILAGTENDTVYALDEKTGAVRWHTHVGPPQPQSGLPCGDIDPLGITGTMAYDQATGRVFAMAETTGGVHTLYGIDARTGAVAVRVPVEPPKGEHLPHQQRSALTVLDDRVYVAYGGLAGDCGNYIGSVVSVTTAGTDPLSYAIPTTREAGIWAPGGAAVSGGNLLYSDGNGESTSGGYDGSDSVIALSPTLNRVDLFAPATWPQDNASDLDLGSSSPVLLGPWVFVAGKRGTGYAMHSGRLGGVGGQAGMAEVCRSFGGASVDGDTAYLPCTDGPRSLTIRQDGTPVVGWHAPVPAKGAPTIGGGAVWVADYDAGRLYALDEHDGHVLAQVDVGSLPHFASPTLAGSRAYLGTTGGVVAVDGA
jgi:outer membrane protein assembly factor BamB